MPKVLLETYSRYFDTREQVQFSEVLDRRTGCYVAVADVTEEQAARYGERPAFQVLTDDEWLAMTAARKPAVAVPAPATGDPLTDAAAVASQPAADLGSMPFADLKKLASSHGVKVVGVKRDEIEAALEAKLHEPNPALAGGPPPPPPSK